MNLLIISQRFDVHALAVATVLIRAGNEVLLWSGPEVVGELGISIRMDSIKAGWVVANRFIPIDHFDLVWLRRRHWPTISANIHSEDIQFAKEENYRFFADLWTPSIPYSIWLHFPENATKGESKIRQLTTARHCGFDVPKTLLSNSREEIVKFIAEAKKYGSEVIYKTFDAASWIKDDRIRIKHTTVVTEYDISNDDTITNVPGIYQWRLMKKFEVRANFFGDQCIAVRINSQQNSRGQVDWRDIFELDGYLEPFELPREVHQRCITVMRTLQLSVACFDLVVDLEDRFIFIELNQQGQFLWIEETCKEIRLLESFSRFLVSFGDRSNKIQKLDAGPVSFEEVRNADDYVRIRTELSKHGFYMSQI